MGSKLIETKIDSEMMYDGRVIKVTRDRVALWDGKEAVREIVHHGGAITVAPLDRDLNLYFVKQYRYAVGRVVLELPAGKLEGNEDPLLCCERELSEETGFTAGQITPLGIYFPTTGYCTEKIYFYLAQDLTEGAQHLDEDEFVEVQKIPLKKAVDMVMRGEIEDGKSIGLILKVWEKVRRDGIYRD